VSSCQTCRCGPLGPPRHDIATRRPMVGRPSLNAGVEAYAGFVALAATGLLLRYQLPPGSGGLPKAADILIF
ncbi:MAG TPA: hypothetical protein PJ982_12150, partial [Lacipirellulaceae bacterium]|nr:hypothetical protein [Lacipirellulaceae bacterium]